MKVGFDEVIGFLSGFIIYYFLMSISISASINNDNTLSFILSLILLLLIVHSISMSLSNKVENRTLYAFYATVSIFFFVTVFDATLLTFKREVLRQLK